MMLASQQRSLFEESEEIAAVAPPVVPIESIKATLSPAQQTPDALSTSVAPQSEPMSQPDLHDSEPLPEVEKASPIDSAVELPVQNPEVVVPHDVGVNGVVVEEVQAVTPAPVSEPFQPDILLVDIAGLGYAAMYTPLGKLTHNGFPTGGIQGAITSLFTRMAQRPGAVPVVLWDNKAHWRHDLLPEYKSSRGIDPEKKAIRESYKIQVPYIQMILYILGIPQVSCSEAEADDLAGVICRNLDASWFIELTSRDEDWLQELRKEVVWYSPVHKMGLSLEDFMNPEVGTKDGHYLSTAEFLEAKALSGDKSDEIPGISGIGPKTAVKVIREHGTSIRDFWAKVDSGEVKPKGVKAESLATPHARAIFEINRKMMDWSLSPDIKHDTLAFTAGKPDWQQFELEAAELGLKKLVNSAKEALKPWKDGWGPAIDAIDAALNHHIAQQQPNTKRAPRV
jgi:5'-3' exonuclease